MRWYGLESSITSFALRCSFVRFSVHSKETKLQQETFPSSFECEGECKKQDQEFEMESIPLHYTCAAGTYDFPRAGSSP